MLVVFGRAELRPARIGRTMRCLRSSSPALVGLIVTGGLVGILYRDPSMVQYGPIEVLIEDLCPMGLPDIGSSSHVDLAELLQKRLLLYMAGLITTPRAFNSQCLPGLARVSVFDAPCSACQRKYNSS